MSNHQCIDDGIRWGIAESLESGQRQVKICTEFSLTPSVVCNLWIQFQSTEFIDRKSEEVRPKATTSKEDRSLSIKTRRNRRTTVSQLSCYLYAAKGTPLSRVSVSKWLYERGLFARRLAICVLRTSANIRIL
ncbi:transposable element Tcb2 transposase [Trichonephila clavipes]|nr:transposable element Tcb2 transposase [Trichonephila clavipes]